MNFTSCRSCTYSVNGAHVITVCHFFRLWTEFGEQLRTYCISSNGEPTGDSPQAMKLGKVLKTRPHKKNSVLKCYKGSWVGSCEHDKETSVQ